jgi:hypothetical protein
MKVFQALIVSSVLVLATVGAHAASFIGQTVDGVLGTNQTPGVTTQFTSPIIAPGTFDGVMQDVFSQTWDVSVEVLSNEVIIEWTGDGNGNVGSTGVLTVDLSGYTDGPVLGPESYSCTSPGTFPCTSFSGPGPSIGGLTSTPTSFDVSFNTLRSGETYVFGTPAVPEPSTWAMMLLGFAGLGFAGYRQRRTLKGT